MIELIGCDGGDTFWQSQDFYAATQAEFERIVNCHVDLADAPVVGKWMSQTRFQWRSRGFWPVDGKSGQVFARSCDRLLGATCCVSTRVSTG